MSEEKPKIHIDSDWKERAAKEKGEAAETAAPSAARERPPLPPADLVTHLSQLISEAAVALGDVEHPATGKQEPDAELARYLIDTVAMLQDKTEGNRTDTESQMFERALYSLRLRYVDIAPKPPQE